MRQPELVRLGLALLISAALPATVHAQFKPANPANAPVGQVPSKPPKADEPPVYSVKVNLVRLLVSVRDHNGGLITNLNKDDFRVADDGTPQDISVFERNTSLPLSVAILIDTSGSTQADIHYETSSVLKFVPALLGAGNPQDSFALFSFNWRTSLESDFSRSAKRAEKALRMLHGEGGTSMYDAIYLASDSLSDREGRHVMVVITDGGDTTSYKKYEDALAAAQRADAVLYPVVVVPIAADAGRNTGGEHALWTLASSTGGRVFNPEGFAQLDRAFEDILHELRTQYLIAYYPRNVRAEPKRYHPVAVELKDRSLKVSSRSGYYEP